jgi:phage terminase large subunit-like protein
MMAITTAGFNTQSFAYQHENYVKSILDGKTENDSIFGIVWCPDDGDDPHHQSVWQKVNPNWGVSLDQEQFRFAYIEAKSHPQKWNEFLTKKLNLWTTANAAFLSSEKVARVFKSVDVSVFAGRRAYLALDLSISHDLTGYSLTFETAPGEKPVTIFRAWIPEESLADRIQKESIDFGQWVEQGWVTVCPGETISYQMVLDQIETDAQTFVIAEIAYDPFNASLLVRELEDKGFNCIKFPQSIKEFSPPTKYLEQCILDGNAIFQDSPVAFWCFTNAEVMTSDYGIKPKKPKNNRQRIDLLICAIMSVWRAVSHSSGGSIYESRGVRFL